MSPDQSPRLIVDRMGAWPRLLLDGKPCSCQPYLRSWEKYPGREHVPFADLCADYRQQYALGCRLFLFQATCASDFYVSEVEIWRSPEVWDWTQLDAFLDFFSRECPEAVLVPLVAVPFITWFWFYDRAIGVAESAGQRHLERIALDVSGNIQQILLATDNAAFEQRMAITNFMPWFTEFNVSLDDKPHIWTQLHAMQTTLPSPVYSMVCGSTNGSFLTAVQRSANLSLGLGWLYAYQHRVGTPAAQIGIFFVNITNFDSDPKAAYALFRPNATFKSLRAQPNVVAVTGSRVAEYRAFPAHIEAKKLYDDQGVTRGWTRAAPIQGGIHDKGLGTAAWFALNDNPAEPLSGLCYSWLYLGDIHKVLAGPDLGEHGMLMLLDDDGYVCLLYTSPSPRD